MSILTPTSNKCRLCVSSDVYLSAYLEGPLNGTRNSAHAVSRDTSRDVTASGDSNHSPGRDQDDGGLAVAPAKPKLKRPPLYKVVLLNDDYTPMEFVVEILEGFFGLNREKATQIMLTVHTQGKGVCGIYPKDIAETKATQVNQHARDNGHPLLCEVEPSEDEDD